MIKYKKDKSKEGVAGLSITKKDLETFLPSTLSVSVGALCANGTIHGAIGAVLVRTANKML